MFSEGRIDYDDKDFRFTYKKGVVYAFQMGKPKTTDVTIQAFHSDRCGCGVKAVSTLGVNHVKDFALDKKGLHIILDEKIASELPVCYKLELE